MRCTLVILSLFCLLCIPVGVIAAKKGVQKNEEKVTTYTCWSPDALYFAFRVPDPMIVGTQKLWLGQPWQDDAIALYLCFDGRIPKVINAQCLRVIVSAAGGVTVQRGMNGEWRNDPSWFDPLSPKGTIRYALKVLGTGKINTSRTPSQGYQVEIGLSWNLLGVSLPLTGNPDAPLPYVNCAFANYSQGETQNISTWPPGLTEDDLRAPDKWGKLYFAQDMKPVALEGENKAVASLVMSRLSMDGNLAAGEWMTAGITTFTKDWGETRALPRKGTQNVSLIAAEYLCDADNRDTPRQPLDPTGPFISPTDPIYHTMQIQAARLAGVDALAVMLRPGEPMRAQLRTSLQALGRAVADYAASVKGDALLETTLLFPMIELDTRLNLNDEATSTAIANTLDDFYRLIPPQYRVMTYSAENEMCYPVMLAHPVAKQAWSDETAHQLLGRFSAAPDRPLGWLLVGDWVVQENSRLLLSLVASDPKVGMQLGSGPYQAALVSPGAELAQREILSRWNGDTFNNSWLKVLAASPDLVIVNSWNDFAHATEVTPSRSDGNLYQDLLRMNTLRLVQGQGFSLRVLNHTIPEIVYPGKSYPVEVVVKNGSLQNIVSDHGFRVDLSITHDGEKVLSSPSITQLMLLELSAARLKFMLPTRIDSAHPLPAGQYLLHLDFYRNQVAFIESKLLRQKLGSISLPFTVAKTPAPVQVLNMSYPERIPTGCSSAKFSYTIRNTTLQSWNRLTRFRVTWQTETTEEIEGAVILSCKGKVSCGALTQITGTLPKAPAQPGWYRLTLELLAGNTAALPLYSGLAQVVETDLNVQFVDIPLPSAINRRDGPLKRPILLKNCGLTTWKAHETRLIYQWLSWDGQPIEGASGSVELLDTVGPGAKTQVPLVLALPQGSGSLRCAFALLRQDEKAVFTINPVKLNMPVIPINIMGGKYQQLSLQNVYSSEEWAAYEDSVIERADFDGKGNAFPLEEFLPDASVPLLGYPIGYRLSPLEVDGPSFIFAQPSRSKAPLVRSTGQVIPLPKQPIASIYLVATSVYAPRPVAFTIRYEDGSEEQRELTIANWLGTPVNAEPIMLRTGHIHTAQGNNWTQQGSLFVYQLATDPTRIPAALVLPKAPEIALFAVTLELVEKLNEDGPNMKDRN